MLLIILGIAATPGVFGIVFIVREEFIAWRDSPSMRVVRKKR